MNTGQDTRAVADAPRRTTSNARRGFFALLGMVTASGIVAIGLAATSPRDVRPSGDMAFDSVLALEARGFVMGRADAPVRIVEFADFECPGCAQFATRVEPDLRRWLVELGYANFTFMDLPLPRHSNSWPAHNAAACADAQDKFWTMHDRLFAGQTEWNGQATDDPTDVFVRYARDIGLDVAQWKQCFETRQFERRIHANRAEALRRRVRGTPTVFVNGREFAVASYHQLKAVVDSLMAEHAVSAASAPTMLSPAIGSK